MALRRLEAAPPGARLSSSASASSASLPCSFTSIDVAGRDDKTPLLCWVAEARCRDAVKVLLTAGARADIRCRVDGATVLHATARCGDEAVALLGEEEGSCNRTSKFKLKTEMKSHYFY